MKKEEERIDKLIKETLSKEEARFYDKLDEQNLFGKLGEIYKGKLGWLVIIMNVMHIVIFVLFIYCLVQFFNAKDTNTLILWASAGFLSMIFIGMLKLYMWLQMDKNDILRELKRVELQVSALSNKIEK